MMQINKKQYVVMMMLLTTIACGRSVDVKIQAREACDQQGTVLESAQSFRMVGEILNSSEEFGEESFSAKDTSKKLTMPIDQELLVRVEAYEKDVSQDATATAGTPLGLGYSVPFSVNTESTDMTLNVIVGKTDTVGAMTNQEGKCVQMTGSAPIPGRHAHTATWIPQISKVLIVGGAVYNSEGEESFLDSVELLDMHTGEITALSPIVPRAYHTATLLPDGRVLIAGGFSIIEGQIRTLQTALVFDPQADNPQEPFRTLVMQQARALHSATFVEETNQIVLVGGCTTGNLTNSGCSPRGAGEGSTGISSTTLGIAQIESFDVTLPAGQERLVAVESATLNETRAMHSAAVIGAGASTSIVIVGGVNGDGPVCGIELLQFQNSQWVKTTPQSWNLAFPDGACPVLAASVALDEAHIAINGGYEDAFNGEPQGNASKKLWIFSTINGLESSPSTTTTGTHAQHSIILMKDGSLMLVGGNTTGSVIEKLTRNNPSQPFVASTTGAQFSSTRLGGALAMLSPSQWIYTGGFTDASPRVTSSSMTLYFGK